MHEIRLHPQVEKRLDDLQPRDFSLIDYHIRNLAINPRPHGVVKLYRNVHRIRVGDYRVIYSILDKEKVVLISKVARRTERTYKRI